MRSGTREIIRTPRKRVRVTLLVLLWIWAGSVFLVLDLFLNVPEFDAVRPRAGFYWAMRKTAHDMVGESMCDPSPWDARVGISHEVVEDARWEDLERIREAIEDRRWADAHRLADRAPIVDLRDRALAPELAAGLRRVLDEKAHTRQEALVRTASLEALEDLVLRAMDAELAGDLVHLLVDCDDEKNVRAVSRVLQRALADKARVSDDARDRVVVRSLERILLTSCSDGAAAIERRRAAGQLLAVCGTAEATRALVDAARNGSPEGVAVRGVCTEAAVAVLSEALCNIDDPILANHVAGGLGNCGRAGLDELRRLVGDEGLSQSVGASCLLALAAAFQADSDLDVIAKATARFADSRASVADVLGASVRTREAATAAVRYLVRSPDGVLVAGLVHGLAAAPAGVPDEAIRTLAATQPSIHRMLVEERSSRASTLQRHSPPAAR
jgi:hypothetical protein